MCDIVKANLVLNNEAQLESVVSGLLATGKVFVFRNGFAKPLFSGVREAQMKVVVDGFVCEVKIQLLSFLAHKPALDEHYNFFHDMFADTKSYESAMGFTVRNLGFLGTNITAGVINTLKIGSRKQLAGFIKLCSPEMFDDPNLFLEGLKSLVPMLERGNENGAVSEIELLEGVMDLGKAFGRTKHFADSGTCLERAREGFEELLGPEHEKSLMARYITACQTQSPGKKTTMLEALLQRAQSSLGVHRLTSDIANDLAYIARHGGNNEEAKEYFSTALVLRKKVIGEKHVDTLDTLMNLGVLSDGMEEYSSALKKSMEHKERAIRWQEKTLGVANKETLKAIMSTALAWANISRFEKAEAMYGTALKRYEQTLGEGHNDTKRCAESLVSILALSLKSHEKIRAIVDDYPHLMLNGWVEKIINDT